MVRAFKRRGVSATLEFRHEECYIEFNHLNGHLQIFKNEKEIIQNKNHSGVVTSSYSRINSVRIYNYHINYSNTDPLPAIPMIEDILKNYNLKHVKIARTYIEAYCIGDNERLEDVYPIVRNDLSIYKGIFVDGLTVQQVMQEIEIDFLRDFKDFKVERVWDIIERNLTKVKNMWFSEFYVFLKGNCFKVNYREICEKFFA
ncbi:hypothetical protein P9Z80_24085 [Bacillus cereus]|nr:hypothetical protein [Bacillus cereus]MEC3260691.1 hypothetical protein [Bacillus cereus]